MRTLLIVVALSCLFPLCAFAQGGAEPADPSTTPAQWYGSVAGVAAATSLIVSMLKRVLGSVAGFQRVPTWLYAAGIGGGLTALCAYVFGTLPGDPLQLVMQSVLNGAASSGFYSWLNSGTVPLADSLAKTQVS